MELLLPEKRELTSSLSPRTSTSKLTTRLDRELKLEHFVGDPELRSTAFKSRFDEDNLTENKTKEKDSNAKKSSSNSEDYPRHSNSKGRSRTDDESSVLAPFSKTTMGMTMESLPPVPSSMIPADVLASIIEYNVKSAAKESHFDGKNEPPLSSMINKNPYRDIEQQHLDLLCQNGNDYDSSTIPSTSSSSDHEDEQTQNQEEEDKKTGQNVNGEKEKGGISSTTSDSESDHSDEDGSEKSQDSDSDITIGHVDGLSSVTDNDGSKDTSPCKNVGRPPSYRPKMLHHEHRRLLLRSQSQSLNFGKYRNIYVKLGRQSKSKTRRKNAANSYFQTQTSQEHQTQNQSETTLLIESKTKKSRRRKNGRGKGKGSKSKKSGRHRRFGYPNQESFQLPSSRQKSGQGERDHRRPIKFHRFSQLNLDSRLINATPALIKTVNSEINHNHSNDNNSTPSAGSAVDGEKKLTTANSEILDNYLYAPVPATSSILREEYTEIYRQDPATGQIIKVKRLLGRNNNNNNTTSAHSQHLIQMQRRQRHTAFMRKVKSRNLWGVGPRLPSGATLVSEVSIEDAPGYGTQNHSGSKSKSKVKVKGHTKRESTVETDSDDNYYSDYENEIRKPKKMTDAGVQFPPIWSWSQTTSRISTANNKDDNIYASSNNNNNSYTINNNEVDGTINEYNGVFIGDLSKLCPRPISENSKNNNNNNIIGGEGDQSRDGLGKNLNFFLQNNNSEQQFTSASGASAYSRPRWKPGFSGVEPPFYDRPATRAGVSSSDTSTMDKNQSQHRRLVAISKAQIVSASPHTGSECFLEPLIYPAKTKKNNKSIQTKDKSKSKKVKKGNHNCDDDNNDDDDINVSARTREFLEALLKNEDGSCSSPFNFMRARPGHLPISSSSSKNKSSSDISSLSDNNNSNTADNINANNQSTTKRKNSSDPLFNTGNIKLTTPVHNTDTEPDSYDKTNTRTNNNQAQPCDSDYDLSFGKGLNLNANLGPVKITSAEELAKQLRKFSLKVSQSKLKQGQLDHFDVDVDPRRVKYSYESDYRSSETEDDQHDEASKKKGRKDSKKYGPSSSSSSGSRRPTTQRKTFMDNIPSRTDIARSLKAPLELKAGLSMQKLLTLTPVQRLKYMRDSYRQSYWSAGAPLPVSSMSSGSRPRSRPFSQEGQKERQPTTIFRRHRQNGDSNHFSSSNNYSNKDYFNHNRNNPSYTIGSLASWISPHNPTNPSGMTANALADFAEQALSSSIK